LFFLRDVKMGYRRLKEKVKEYNRREAKFYGNMIDKLSKLEDDKAVSSLFRHLVSILPWLSFYSSFCCFQNCKSQGPSKKRGLWPLAMSLLTTDGSSGSKLRLVLRLLIPVMVLVALCVAYYVQSGVPEIDCINC
jgi:peptidylprolyl isomerase